MLNSNDLKSIQQIISEIVRFQVKDLVRSDEIAPIKKKLTKIEQTTSKIVDYLDKGMMSAHKRINVHDKIHDINTSNF